MEHDLEARRRLGRAVRTARRAAGLSKTAEWAERVGRSDRMLLGLERGEAVGPDTYRAVATALGWPLEHLYGVLEGIELAMVGSPALASVSDEELAAEVLRRMKIGGAEDADSPTATKAAGSGRRLQAVDNEAARDVGREGSNAKARREQDQAGEPPTDNPDDMEPR